MSLSTDLLAQARMLIALDPTRPKQVNLRRAISASYYGLFHLLTVEATSLYIWDDADLANRFSRAINHVDICKVSKSVAENILPKIMDRWDGTFLFPQKLIQVAKAVAGLQEARHEADYNLSRSFSRDEATGIINMAD